MATRHKSNNILQQPIALAIILVIAVALFVTYYATSGQTAKFYAARGAESSPRQGPMQIITVEVPDKDRDGFCASISDAEKDCNNNDPGVYPSAREVCDGKDNNCNGQIDEDPACVIDSPFPVAVRGSAGHKGQWGKCDTAIPSFFDSYCRCKGFDGARYTTDVCYEEEYAKGLDYDQTSDVCSPKYIDSGPSASSMAVTKIRCFKNVK